MFSENEFWLKYFLYQSNRNFSVHSDGEDEDAKVNLSLCLIKHHAMKMYGGVEV